MAVSFMRTPKRAPKRGMWGGDPVGDPGFRSRLLAPPVQIIVRRDDSRQQATRSQNRGFATEKQPFLAVEPPHFLVVQQHSIPPQQQAEAAVTEPAPLARQTAQPGAHGGIIVPPPAV